ncbi:RNA polymerase sigma factor [Emergencia sp.]|uniref:RNA polymerase sigma factor n=1 Tax=Emergencia sp. TaxID=1926557 RepID=UPI003AF03D63
MTDIEKIYIDHFETVYKYVLSLSRDECVADEITQEAFFKALKNIDAFRGQCKLTVWLCQIAKNCYFTYLEKEKKKTPLYSEEKAALSGRSLEHAFVDKETAMQIHQILHDLAEPYKEVFSLRTFGELSFREIGDLFEKTESWARVTCYRAKLQIRQHLDEEEEQNENNL